MSTSLARRERHALCDLALDLGPAAPTLCGDWDATRLMAHLLVREQRPIGSLGIVLPPLAGLAEHAMDRAAASSFPHLVERVRSPRLTPFTLGPVDRLANTLEYLVHHEDLRRAQPGWAPRELAQPDVDAGWAAIRRAGRLLVRKAGVPVEIAATDASDAGTATTLRGGGTEPVRVEGPAVEVVLWLYGRDQVRELRFTGPQDQIARLQDSPRGL